MERAKKRQATLRTVPKWHTPGIYFILTRKRSRIVESRQEALFSARHEFAKTVISFG